MNDTSAGKRNVTSKRAIELLEKKGIKINEKKAGELLDLMYFLAKLIVNQNVTK